MGARCGTGAGSPRPHQPHPGHTGRVTPTARPRGQAARGGTAPDFRRPSQRQKAAPPVTPFRHPHSEQRRPARAHAPGPVLGPHGCTDCSRDTRVAEPRLPAPEDGRPGEGQRLTPDALHNGCRPPPPGTAPHRPCGMQPPRGMQAKVTVLGPHTCTPVPAARGWRTPTARPEDGQPGEGERLTADAPHSGERHPPRGCPSATLTARNASPQGRTLWGRCQVPTPASTAPGANGSRNPGRPPQRAGDRGRDSARHQTPLTTVAGHPPGTAPHHFLRHAAPTGHASQGDCAEPPYPHIHAHGTWVVDPDSPPGGQAAGRGGTLGLRRPSWRRKATPPGTPSSHPHSAQRQQARAHAVGPVLSLHARTDHIRGTRAAEPRLPAPEGGRPGKGQRLTPDAPHNGGRPPPPQTAPHHPRGMQPPQGMQAKGTVLGPHTRTPALTARG